MSNMNETSFSYCFCQAIDGSTSRFVTNIDDIIHNSDRLIMQSVFLTHEGCRELGSILSRCQKIHTINLSYNRLTEKAAISLIFQSGGGTYSFPLEQLILKGNRFGPRGVLALLPFLRSRTTDLHCLDCSSCDIDDEGGRILAEAMDFTSIKDLNLSHNPIGFRGLSSILASKSAVELRSLDLIECSIGREGIDEIIRFLDRGNEVALEEISFGENGVVEVESIELLLRSLRNRTKITKLAILDRIACIEAGADGFDEETSLRQRVADAVTKLICDTSSFETFCQSNHTLGYFLFHAPNCYIAPEKLKKAFHINRRADLSMNEKLRCKLRSIYFREEFDVEYFMSMKTVWLPNVLELISIRGSDPFARAINKKCINLAQRGMGNLNGMFRFVRRWDYFFNVFTDASHKQTKFWR
ncbi:hypothetical protein ACHAXS_004718 [Conticribra weissflogii]